MIRDWINLPSRKPNKPAESSAASKVYVDVIFENGLFFLELVNARREPAYDVSVKFDKTLNGVEVNRGVFKEVNKQQLFQNVPFLAPGKRIRSFWERSERYFEREEPMKFGLTVTFRDRSGKAHKHQLQHDLGIYRDLGFIDR